MKDNSKADVSHTDEFDKMYKEMVKQAEDKYNVKSKYPETKKGILIHKFGGYSDNEPLDVPTMTTNFVKEHGLPCPNGYIFKDENGNVIEAKKIVLEKKKPKYPTTYKECSEIVNGCRCKGNAGWKSALLIKLQELIVCRDAYWKIAGKKMRLGKPWKPDWTNLDQLKYCIWVDVGEFITMTNVRGQHILAFPTEEMRDAFYEAFKELIEECKELL